MKNLIIVSAGDNSNHPTYSTNKNKLFDVALVYYGDSDTPPYDKSTYDYFYPIKGFKYRNIFQFLESKPELLKQYDYFWLPDDDIISNPITIDAIFKYACDNELYISQPSIRGNGYWSHNQETYNTAQLQKYEYKPSEVEVMMPLFSREALEKYLPLFENSYTGWGLDSVWSHVSSQDDKKIGVIHKYSCEHLRPIGTGEAYKNLEKIGITPMGELNKLAEEYDLKREGSLNLTHLKPSLKPNNMEKITFCIPSKSNLRYLKTCIPSIRKNAYRDDHDIIVFVDSDEDGTVDWLEQVKDEYNLSYYVNPNLGEKLFGIGKAYDFCIEKSTTDLFMIFHADMILGKHADLNLYKTLEPKTVGCSTRIEPPLHPNNGEKILLDLGTWPEEFKEEEFNTFVNEGLITDRVTDGIFAPWMMRKSDYALIGGHDPSLHSCREDSDIFNRLQLAGFTFKQAWNSLVYHFTGRGAGSFDGDPERHKQWQLDMNRSTLEFIRKWGSNVNHTPLMKPIISPKYKVNFRVHNNNIKLLETLEPWCDTYYGDGVWVQYDYFIKNNQQHTTTNLKNKIKPLEAELYDDFEGITVIIDGNTFTQQDFQFIQVLSEVIKEGGEIGEFELGNMKVNITSLETFEKDLIFIENSHNEKN